MNLNNNPKEPSVPNNPGFPLTPDVTALLDSFDDRIAALDRRMAAFDLRMANYDTMVRAALMASDASSETITELIIVVNQHGDSISQLHDVDHIQAAYIERLDDLWHAHLSAACDLVMTEACGEPSPDDQLQVDLWHLGDDIVKRSET